MNYEALQREPNQTDVMAYMTQTVTGRKRRSFFKLYVEISVLLVLAVFTGLFVGQFQSGNVSGWFFASLFVSCLAAGLCYPLAKWTWLYIVRQRFAHEVKMNAFAAVNNIVYVPKAHFQYDTMGGLFSDGLEALASFDHKQFVIGNFKRYSDHKGGRYKVRGLLKLSLNRQLQHMYLQNIHLRNHGDSLAFDDIAVRQSLERLRLEGNFDEYFALYCTPGYEQEALTVFTPDIMQLVIENNLHLDIEIVGRTMYFYNPYPFTLDDETVLESLFMLINVMRSKNRLLDDHTNVVSSVQTR